MYFKSWSGLCFAGILIASAALAEANEIPPDSSYYYPPQYGTYRSPGAFDRRVNQSRVDQQVQQVNYGNSNVPSSNPYYYQNPVNPPVYNQRNQYNPVNNPTYPVIQNSTAPSYPPNTTAAPIPSNAVQYPPNRRAVNSMQNYPQNTQGQQVQPNYVPGGTFPPGTTVAPAVPPANIYGPNQTNYTPGTGNIPNQQGQAVPRAPAVPVYPTYPTRPSYAPAPGEYGSGFSIPQGNILRNYDQLRDSILNSNRGSYNPDPSGSQQSRLKGRAIKQQEELMKRLMKQQEQLGR